MHTRNVAAGHRYSEGRRGIRVIVNLSRVAKQPSRYRHACSPPYCAHAVVMATPSRLRECERANNAATTRGSVPAARSNASLLTSQHDQRIYRLLIRASTMSVEGEFLLSTTGSIEHAQFYDIDNAYCKYGFHFGPEWTVAAVSFVSRSQVFREINRATNPAGKSAMQLFRVDTYIRQGIEEGLTQMCTCRGDPTSLAVWNFPLEITFKSTNPHGWPQLILSIYGLDIFGHDIIRGYGVCHLPLQTGNCARRIPVYAPESSSALQQFAAWLTGRRPELIDPAILASGRGREVTRMRVQGVVTVTFNVVLKDFFKLGYDNGEKRGK